MEKCVYKMLFRPEFNELSIDMLFLDLMQWLLFKYCLLCVLSIPCKLFSYNYWGAVIDLSGNYVTATLFST